MLTKEQLLSFLFRNKNFFREKYHVVSIGIFGSFARGEQTQISDIDLLVEFEENTQNLYEIKRQLRRFFHEQLNIEVDICRERYLKPRYKESILREAVYAY